MQSDEAHQLRTRLYRGRAHGLYAVVDGARSPRIHPLVSDSGVPCASLYEGPLEPPLAGAAPYLLRLTGDAPLAHDLIAHGWGQAWGVYLDSAASFERVREHLRTLLRVRDPDGRVLLFRFYDPRVLRVYLPSCTPEEARAVFGPIARFIVESETDARPLELTPS
jgi:hypothetical protein